MPTLSQVLGGKNATGVIQGIKSGIPTVVPEAFLRQSSRTVHGKLISWFEVDGRRETARLVQYGSPAKRRELQGVTERSATALHTFEKQPMNALELLRLINPATGELDPMGVSEVQRQTREFKALFSNLRIAAVQFALCKGVIHFDAEGNLLPSSSGAAVSVDFNIPAGNKAQLDVFGGGDIIDASWATGSTKIIQHIKEIKKASLKKTGYAIKHAFYGSNIPSYLANNTEAKEYLVRNPQANQTFIDSGEVPAGLGGLTWHPLDEAFYVDADGTVQPMIGDDEIAFVPEPSEDWYELIPGSYAVPTTVDIAGDANSALSSLTEQYGMFSYGKVTHDPPSIEQYAGDTFLPLIKVPGAVFLADTTP